MNEKKSHENLSISKGEAIKILIRIRYAKKPQRFDKIIKLINGLDKLNPIPEALKKKLKKDIPCLVLLNYFINPKFYYNTTNELINSKVSFLTEMVGRIQIICHRSPTTNIFWSFVTNIIRYFRDPSQYHSLHRFFTSITKSQEEMKFLLSFTKEDIIYSPIEFKPLDFPTPNESRDDYINFLQLIGIDTTHIDHRFVYKKPKVTKPLKTYFNVREDFTDLTTLPAVSYSYRDKSFLMEAEKISNSTPFVDMIANHRYFSISTDPIASTASAQSSQTPKRSIEKSEKDGEYNENGNNNSNNKNSTEDATEQKLNYDYEITSLSFKTSDDLHKQEYRMGLLEMSFFELKKHFGISNEAIQSITNETEINSNFEEFKNKSKIKNKSKNKKQNNSENQLKLKSEAPYMEKFILMSNNGNDNILSPNAIEGNATNLVDQFENDGGNNKSDNNLYRTVNKQLRPFFMRDHWRVYRVLSILYDKNYALPVERIFRTTYNNGNQLINYDISDKVEKIMKHIFIAMIKMKINWYHSQYQAFLEYSFSKPRCFPHPEFCEISIIDIENYNSRSAPETAEFLSKLSNAIMVSYTNSQNQSLVKENNNKYLIDKNSIDLLTLFSQYYKYFICYYFYQNYITPPFVFLNAAMKWKYIYFNEMKDIIGRSEIEEDEDSTKMFCNESIRRMLSEEESYIIKKEYKRETTTANFVIATFDRENNGRGDNQKDSIIIKVSPVNKETIRGVTMKITEPKNSQNNNSPKSHKKKQKNE